MARVFRNYDRDEVVAILRESLEVMAELEVGGDLRVPAFQKVVDMLSQKQLNAQDVAVELQRGLEPAVAQLGRSL